MNETVRPLAEDAPKLAKQGAELLAAARAIYDKDLPHVNFFISSEAKTDIGYHPAANGYHAAIVVGERYLANMQSMVRDEELQAVMAHEMGHHVHQHQGGNTKVSCRESKRAELEADMAGFVLFNKVTGRPVESYHLLLANDIGLNESATHPSLDVRAQAIYAIAEGKEVSIRFDKSCKITDIEGIKPIADGRMVVIDDGKPR